MPFLHDTTVVSGLSKLGDKLERLPLQVKEKVAKKAMLEAAKVGLAAIQTEAPYKSGNLYRHLRVAQRKDDPFKVTYVVFVKSRGRTSKKKGARSGPSEPSTQMLPFYWYFIEFGTSRITANPFMLRGFMKSADNAAARARDKAAYALRDIT